MVGGPHIPIEPEVVDARELEWHLDQAYSHLESALVRLENDPELLLRIDEIMNSLGTRGD